MRTLSRVTQVEDFNDIVITTRNGFPVKIRDIGRVEDGGVDPQSAASLNGVPSVSVGIRKQSGANTIAVINDVKQRMAKIQPHLPAGHESRRHARPIGVYRNFACMRSKST